MSERLVRHGHGAGATPAGRRPRDLARTIAPWPATTPPRPSSSSMSRTTSPTRPASLHVKGGEAVIPFINDAGGGGPGGRGACRLHAGLAPAQHAALRQGWRHLAGPLRGRELGRAAPPGPAGHGSGRPQGHARRGRLQRLHDARPRDRRDQSDRASRICCGEAGVERVVVAGLATDYCVKATALDALALGYPTTVLAQRDPRRGPRRGRRRASPAPSCAQRARPIALDDDAVDLAAAGAAD